MHTHPRRVYIYYPFRIYNAHPMLRRMPFLRYALNARIDASIRTCPVPVNPDVDRRGRHYSIPIDYW